MKPKQTEFGRPTRKLMEFGGAKLKGNAREKRPFHKHMHTHLVLRSGRAVGERSMLRKRNKLTIEQIVRKSARKFEVKIHRFVNVGNHLHLAIKASRRDLQANFLRTITGLIARQVMKCEKGSPGRFEGFWDAKPYTKLVSFGRQFERLMTYFALNSLEAIGFTKSEGQIYLRTLSSA